ncbi:MAG: DUF3597 family protein [Verrucomicrobia bacterium]|nr:DUF3597 family protein [Verrucomicrobiota bacterium]
MAINPQQTFANFILSKVVPALGGQASASNLEWNAKKFLGQVPGESLDAATYAERTLADLEAAAAAAPGNADIANAFTTLSERFGVGRAVASSSSSLEGAGAGGSGGSGSGGEKSSEGAADSAGGGGGGDFDIYGFLSQKADEADEDLSWDTSVVDLLKLLGQDSSVSARRGYMEALDLDPKKAGSAEGNEDLHAALMDELAASRGEWPAKLG